MIHHFGRRRPHRRGVWRRRAPVYDDPNLRLEGLDAVADKDRVAAILGGRSRLTYC